MKKDTLKRITDFLPNLEEFTISLTGLNKNSGKTITLIHLIKQLYKMDLNVAVTSIGFDGEKVDMIFSHDKPEFIVPKGTIVATAEFAVNKIKGNYTILDDLDEYGPLGKTYIIKANQLLPVELVGPSSTDGLILLKDKLKKYNKRIFIDGAYNRLAQISPKLANYLILSIGGTSLEITKKRMKKFSVAKTIPKYIGGSVTQLFNQDSHYILDKDLYKISDDNLKSIKDKKIAYSGAFTNEVARVMLKNNNTIILDDITKIFVNKNLLHKLISNHQIYVNNKEKLILVSYNPKNFNGPDYKSKVFGEQMSKEFKELEFCDVVSSYCYKGGKLDAILK